MAKKYANYRNPSVHSVSGAVTCVKNGKDHNVTAGMRLNGLSSIKTGPGAKAAIILDDGAKKGKLCGLAVGGGAVVNIASGASGITVEIASGPCTEIVAEQDGKFPGGGANAAMGIRG